jgi:hypothetical protein
MPNDSGGGIDNENSSLTLTNCTFTGNAAGQNGGGGMFNDESSPTITNCTFVSNAATGHLGSGGAMYNAFGTPKLYNCILWGNTATSGHEGIDDSDGKDVSTLSHTDSQDLSNPKPDPNNSNNFGANPEFMRDPNVVVDPSTRTVNLSQSDFGDLHLQKGSQCIDAGDNTKVTTPPFPTDSTGTFAIDLDGNKRIVNGGVSLTVDLGAYEYFARDTTPPVISVPNDITVFATSTAGAVVTFTATATDDVDGTDPVTCTPASGTVFAPGKTTVNCSASDAAGNPATSKSFVVWVQYAWSGYLSPLNRQSFNRGSTIPVKFQLTGASAPITNLSATLSVTAPSGVVTPLGTFKYDPTMKQYLYNWNTSKTMSAGTYTLTADFGDGVTRTIQVVLR